MLLHLHGCLAEGNVRLKNLDATIKRLIKRLFLALNHFLNVILFRAELGENMPHFFSKDGDDLVEERLMKAKRAAITHGAAQDASEYIATALVRRVDTIGYSE